MRGAVDTIQPYVQATRSHRRVDWPILGGNTMADAQFTTFYDFR